jgi:hypothetical protein
MKKTVLTALALCLLVFGGIVATGTAQTAISKTKVKVTFSKGNPPYSESAFTGKLKTVKQCRPKRKVSIKGVGKAKTDKKGRFTIATSKSLAPGKYVVKVKKRNVKKNGVSLTCLKGKKKIKVS